ncbi:MAG: cation diffusion facilitator family transporter [Gammaproteobacteria bacterium]|jgi:cation diffusion facilitator family transporter
MSSLDASSRVKSGSIQRIILIEGLINVLVLLVKVFVGISSGSLAVLGDAIHSLSDVANNVVAWFVIRLSNEPADREHPYGHKKFETLAVFGLAGLLTVLGFELILRALQREAVVVVSSKWGFILMGAVLVSNIVLAVWEHHWAKKLDSDLLAADASHTLSDVLTTLVVIIGWQLSSRGYAWLDTLCALGVGTLVLYLSYTLFKRALPALVDEAAIEPQELAIVVRSVGGVESVKSVRSRWLGSNRAVDMVITVDPELSIAESHEIADRIEKLIERRFDAQDISIHVEPHAKTPPAVQ